MQTLERAPDRPGRLHRRRFIRPLAIVILTTFLFWVLSSIGMLIYTAGAREPTTHELLVPEGTSSQLAAFSDPLELPSTWSYYSGDLLVVDNRDSVVHTLGQWAFPPATVTTVELTPNYAGLLTCSLHPDGQITITVEPRGYDLGMVLVPTFIGGPVLGVIAIGVIAVMRAIDQPFSSSEDEEGGEEK